MCIELWISDRLGLKSFISNSCIKVNSQQDINNIMNKILEMFETSGKEVFTSTNKRNIFKQDSKPWYTHTCYEYRKKIHRARKTYNCCVAVVYFVFCFCKQVFKEMCIELWISDRIGLKSFISNSCIKVNKLEDDIPDSFILP
jgi:hypothetical protein